MSRRRGLVVGTSLCLIFAALITALVTTSRPAKAAAPNVEKSFQTVAGVLRCPGPFALPLPLPANVLLLLDIDASSYGSPLDSQLTIVGPQPATTIVAQNDDDPLSLDSALGVIIPTTGTYTITIADVSGGCGPNHFFLLSGTAVPVR